MAEKEFEDLEKKAVNILPNVILNHPDKLPVVMEFIVQSSLRTVDYKSGHMKDSELDVNFGKLRDHLEGADDRDFIVDSLSMGFSDRQRLQFGRYVRCVVHLFGPSNLATMYIRESSRMLDKLLTVSKQVFEILDTEAKAALAANPEFRYAPNPVSCNNSDALKQKLHADYLEGMNKKLGIDRFPEIWY